MKQKYFSLFLPLSMTNTPVITYKINIRELSMVERRQTLLRPQDLQGTIQW